MYSFQGGIAGICLAIVITTTIPGQTFLNGVLTGFSLMIFGHMLGVIADKE